MNRLFLIFLVVFCSSAALFAAQAEPVPDATELQIGLSPEAAAKAERSGKLDLVRRSVLGDAGAASESAQLPQAQQTSLLAELAITPDDRVPRANLVKRLARQSRSDDPEGTGLVGLARVAVAEGDGQLRRLAQRALAARGDERTPKLLASALRHEDQLVRDNAIAALKAFGGPRVVEVIVERWKEIWGASPRNHAFFGRVQSYVADYEISGDSYDPVIRTFFTGTVLDSKILKVESDVYRITIREIAPEALADNPEMLAKWLAAHRPRLEREAQAGRRKALAALFGDEDE